MTEKFPRKRIKKISDDETKKKKKGKEPKQSSGESHKLWLISKIYNPLNFRLKFNQEAKHQSNQMLKDEIVKKKINLKEFPRWKTSNQGKNDQIW